MVGWLAYNGLKFSKYDDKTLWTTIYFVKFIKRIRSVRVDWLFNALFIIHKKVLRYYFNIFMKESTPIFTSSYFLTFLLFSLWLGDIEQLSSSIFTLIWWTSSNASLIQSVAHD